MLVLGVFALDPPTNPLDEFLPLVAAQRVLAGEVPYRDFTTLYPPLTTLLDAGLLAVAPASVLLARALFALIVIAGLLVVKSIAETLSGSERVGVGAALLALLAQGEPPWGYALVLATVLVLGAFACALREGPRVDDRRGGAPRTRGARPPRCGHLRRARRGARREPPPASRARVGAAAAAAPPLLLVVVLLALGAGRAAFEQLFVIPSTLYPAIRGLPWPAPWRTLPGAPLELALASIYRPFDRSTIALVHALRTREDPRARRGRRAADPPRLLGVGAPGPRARDGGAHRFVRGARHSRRRSLDDVGFVLALVVPRGGVSIIESARVVRRIVAPSATFARWPTRRPFVDQAGVEEDRVRALDAIAEARAAHERIFVALPRHDRIWINDVAFYFDAGLLPATRHHELYPLVATTREVQEEIVRDLERVRPRFVVVSKLAIAKEPNASASEDGSHILDDYIARTYTNVVLDSRRYRVLRR